MKAALTLDKSALDKLVAKFSDPAIRTELERLPQRKAVAALVAQAIADNFDKEGPGWAPLKPETIRRSVSKKLAKKLAEMSDEELLKYEARARKPGTAEAFAGANRRILQRTGMLKKSVTTPGAKGNVWKTEGTNLVWGTDLVYAGVHNNGYPAKNIPQRKFLTIHKEWMDQLNDYILTEAFKIIREHILKGST